MRRLLALLLITPSVAAGAPLQQSISPVAVAESAALPAPSLVVLIAVDQLTPASLERFRAEFTGGFARLTRGAVFTEAYQDHANTETAPGQSVMLSGRYPAGTGILTNESGVEDSASPLIGSTRLGASPARFRGSTLYDWIRLVAPRARALSVSRKDRGAILPIGRAPEEVYWYGYDGRFTTSSWYHDTLPDWVERFNARRGFHRLVGATWSLLLPESAYAEADSIPEEKGGRDVVFPHRVPDDTAQALRRLTSFPWTDSLTLAFALEGVEATGIGRGPHTDLLSVSLSTNDAIGHDWGPQSREQHDHLLRLDRWLGAFLDSLYRLRDSTSIAIALTSDHGVTPYPAIYTRETGRPAGVVSVDTLVRRLRTRMRAAGIPDTSAFRVEDWMLFVDRRAFVRHAALADSLVREFERAARRIPGVQRVETPAAVRARAGTDRVALRWTRMFALAVPIERVVTLAPYYVRGSRSSAQHGSPYDPDAHVPLTFTGRWFVPGRHAGRVGIVDLAPTLARVARVRPTEPIDGHVLMRALVPGARRLP